MKLVILIFASLCISGCTFNFSKKKKTSFIQHEVKKKDIKAQFNSNGTISNSIDIDIKCKASGEIVELPFDVSDTVKKGQLLLKLDPINEQRSVETSLNSLIISQNELKRITLDEELSKDKLALEQKIANTRLEVSKSQFSHSKSIKDRVEKLFLQNLSTQENFDSATIEMIRAQGELDQAKLKLEQLALQKKELLFKKYAIEKARSQLKIQQLQLSEYKQRLQDTSVFAPSDGIITNRNVQKGQIISSGINNVSGGTTILVLSDLNELFVEVLLDETEIGKISKGMKVQFTVEAYPFTNFQGRVTRVGAKAIVRSGLNFFEVKIKADKVSNNKLKPGMSASVLFLIDQRKDVLAIPYSAIFREEGKPYVLKGKDPKSAKKIFVTLGLAADEYEVLAGLNESDQILIVSSEENNPWKKKKSSFKVRVK
ncbi:MAG: efflux RND transporter periplasmic adaptor subunit [Candidatus Cloacimonetes bacterium]|nr:efflux RND transporter periplasmic adaptor subunit [Candidatus Cloacimonadota bacterium]